MARALLVGAPLLGVAALLIVPFHPEAPVLALLRDVTPVTPAWRRLDWLLVESGENFAVFACVGAAVFAAVRRPVLAALFACSLSAAGESAQLIIPGRVPSWMDLLANCLGAVAGVMVCRIIARRAARRTSRRSVQTSAVQPHEG